MLRLGPAYYYTAKNPDDKEAMTLAALANGRGIYLEAWPLWLFAIDAVAMATWAWVVYVLVARGGWISIAIAAIMAACIMLRLNLYRRNFRRKVRDARRDFAEATSVGKKRIITMSVR